MKKLITFPLLLLIAVSLISCGGGGGSSSSSSAGTTGASNGFSGQAQKGPLIFGSRIWVSELDINLNPNGKVYIAVTTDDLGNFKVSSNVGSNLVELIGIGYYMDELTGGLSTSSITLNAIADLTVESTPTINILTTLQAPRIRNLILAGKSYTEAISQSQREVLAAFGIDSTKITDLKALYAMSINGSTDQDSALLATSAILSKMSTIASIANGSSQAAEMSYYLSRIASDIAGSGALSSTSIITARNTATAQIDLAVVRTNVETYYANRGVTLVAPKFEEWVDKDGSGHIPKRKIAATAQTFSNDLLVNPNEVVTSNAITVAGVGNSYVYTQLQSTLNGLSPALVIGGSLVNGLYTTTAEGDAIGIRSTSPNWGGTSKYTLLVGSQSLAYQVTSKPLITTFYQGYTWNGQLGTYGCWNQGGPNTSFQYLAIPFYTDQVDFTSSSTVNSKYIAAGILQSGPGSGPKVPTRIEIQSDNSNSPSGVSLGAAAVGSYSLDGGGTVTDVSNNSYTTHRIPTQGYFGSSGLNLQANTKYWLVAVYSASTNVDLERCGAPDPASYGTVKVSSDGSSWSTGNVGYFPKLFLFK
jgi:hypothetical protein